MMFDIIAFRFTRTVYYPKETYIFPSPNVTAAYYSQLAPAEQLDIKGMSSQIAYWISYLTLMGAEQTTHSFGLGPIFSHIHQCLYLSKDKALKLVLFCLHVLHVRTYCKRIMSMALAFLICRYNIWNEQILKSFLKRCSLVCLPAIILLLHSVPNDQIKKMINKKARMLALKSKSPHNIFLYIKHNPHDQKVADHLYKVSNSIASACILIAYYMQIRKDKRFIDKAIECTADSAHYCRIWETYALEGDYIPLKLLKYFAKWFPIDIFASSPELAKIFLQGG